MRNPRRLLNLLLLAVVPACQSVPEALEHSSAERAAEWMTGSFSSAAQAAKRPDDYFDIRLFMVPIWTERADGSWLYVEQAAASALGRPYRQRVYHVVDTADGPRSDVYELPGDPLELAGAWSTPAAFDAFGPDALTEREGCSIHLVEGAGAFTGATVDEECRSSLRGAAYATSEVTITPEVLTSWDRGFDESGEQVWGAVAGPYVFIKQVGE